MLLCSKIRPSPYITGQVVGKYLDKTEPTNNWRIAGKFVYNLATVGGSSCGCIKQVINYKEYENFNY